MEILFFFFIPPHFTQWWRSFRRLLSVFSLFIQQLRGGSIQILLAQSSGPRKEKKRIRNGDEFQQRGQKNSANSLQMCLWAVWGNTVLPSLWRKKDSALEKVQWITSKKKQKKKNSSDPVQLVSYCLVFHGRERRRSTQEHITFTLWNCWYAGSHERLLVILKANTLFLKGIYRCFIQ